MTNDDVPTTATQNISSNVDTKIKQDDVHINTKNSSYNQTMSESAAVAITTMEYKAVNINEHTKIPVLQLKANEIDAMFGLIDIAKCKNAKETCNTTTSTTTTTKSKPKRKRKYIPKRKCAVDGCTKLSRGNGVGEKGAYCIGHGGRTYPRICTHDGCSHYIFRNKLCAKHYLDDELTK